MNSEAPTNDMHRYAPDPNSHASYRSHSYSHQPGYPPPPLSSQNPISPQYSNQHPMTMPTSALSAARQMPPGHGNVKYETMGAMDKGAYPSHPQYPPSAQQRHESASSIHSNPIQPKSMDPSKKTDLKTASLCEGEWKFELHVRQQPRRARMCGFGDKDRRPITPPPCVRLIITDIKTGREVDVNEVNFSMYVLNVDLWSLDGQREVNLVRHHVPATSQSFDISMAQNTSYQEVSNGSMAMAPSGVSAGFYHPGHPSANTYQQMQYGGPSYQQQGPPSLSNSRPAYPPNGYQGGPQHSHLPFSQGGPPPQAYGHVPGQDPGRTVFPVQQDPALRTPTTQPPSGMFTRNLIGSLSASASRLTDPDDKIGIWFVLQDLSVRTEGDFRLRFSFCNVGTPHGAEPNQTSGPNLLNPGVNSAQLNTGKAPILASCFSECFVVYSAKKFPGVVESTDLSKCFATQGIKIPIRKDGQLGTRGDRGGGSRDEYDNDD